MRTRPRKKVSQLESVSLMESSTQQPSCNSSFLIGTTIRPSFKVREDCTSQNPCHQTQKSLNTRPSTKTKTTQSSMLNAVKNQVSYSPGISPLKATCWLFPLLIVILSYSHSANAQLPFETGSSHRFFGYANKNPRDIFLSVVKNISEDIKPGEVLLNFRAEQRYGPVSYNLS